MADAVVVSSPEETVVEAPVEETDFLEETKAETGRDQQPSTRLAEDSAATPTKRRRSSGSGTTGRKMEKVVVKKLEEVCRLEPKTEVEVVGHMVELYDSKPRGDSERPRSVLTLCLADESFVVSVTLWSPSVERYEEQLKKAMDSCSGAEFPVLKIKSAEVVRVASEPLPLCKVQSRRETTLEILVASSVTIRPQPELVISDMKTMGLQNPGVHVCLRGYLCESKEIRHSRSGMAMKPALLSDENGVAVRVMLASQYAEMELPDGQEVTVFWAQSLRGLQSEDRTEESPGCYWIYAEAYVLEMPKVKKMERVKEINEVNEVYRGPRMHLPQPPAPLSATPKPHAIENPRRRPSPLPNPIAVRVDTAAETTLSTA